MTLIAALLSLACLAISGLHLLWALGLWWPIRDERALVAAVVGIKGATRMPGPIPSAIVTVALACAAALPWLPPGWLRAVGLAMAAGVFLARGVLPYVRNWRRLVPQQPFARLDRRVYGPLCLALGAGFGALLVIGD